MSNNLRYGERIAAEVLSGAPSRGRCPVHGPVAMATDIDVIEPGDIDRSARKSRTLSLDNVKTVGNQQYSPARGSVDASRAVPRRTRSRRGRRAPPNRSHPSCYVRFRSHPARPTARLPLDIIGGEIKVDLVLPRCRILDLLEGQARTVGTADDDEEGWGNGSHHRQERVPTMLRGLRDRWCRM